MPRHTIRVELHGAKPDDYRALREKLWLLGCYDFIRGEENALYRLPTAEYSTRTDLDERGVAYLVKSVTDDLGLQAAILVTGPK